MTHILRMSRSAHRLQFYGQLTIINQKGEIEGEGEIISIFGTSSSAMQPSPRRRKPCGEKAKTKLRKRLSTIQHDGKHKFAPAYPGDAS